MNFDELIETCNKLLDEMCKNDTFVERARNLRLELNLTIDQVYQDIADLRYAGKINEHDKVVILSEEDTLFMFEVDQIKNKIITLSNEWFAAQFN